MNEELGKEGHDKVMKGIIALICLTMFSISAAYFSSIWFPWDKCVAIGLLIYFGTIFLDVYIRDK